MYTPPDMAYDMAATFTGLPVGNAQVEIIRGAPYGMAILSEYACPVNRLLAAQVEHVVLSDPSTLRPPKNGLKNKMTTSAGRKEGMKEAFRNLVRLAGPKATETLGLVSRDSSSVLSFSLRPREVEEDAYQRLVPEDLYLECSFVRLTSLESVWFQMVYTHFGCCPKSNTVMNILNNLYKVLLVV